MDIENALKFCLKHNIHLNEFIILHLTGKNDKLLGDYITKFSYEDKLSGINTDNLIEKGYLKQVEGGYAVTKLFYNLFATEDRFYTDIYNLYPGFVLSDTKRLPVKSGDSFELCKMYMKSIGGSLEEHEEVIEDLKYGIENNLITFSITNFVCGYYREIRKLRKGGDKGSVTSQNLD